MGISIIRLIRLHHRSFPHLFQSIRCQSLHFYTAFNIRFTLDTTSFLALFAVYVLTPLLHPSANRSYLKRVLPIIHVFILFQIYRQEVLTSCVRLKTFFIRYKLSFHAILSTIRFCIMPQMLLYFQFIFIFQISRRQRRHPF